MAPGGPPGQIPSFLEGSGSHGHSETLAVVIGCVPARGRSFEWGLYRGARECRRWDPVKVLGKPCGEPRQGRGGRLPSDWP